jgi:hypothetical protein
MSRFIKETTRPHATSTIEGLAGGGGGLLTVARPYLISEVVGMASHVWVAGGQVYDPYTRGINQTSGWTENGAVPRVAPGVPPGCDGRRTVEGLGPFTDNDFFSLARSLVPAASPFSVCAVMGGSFDSFPVVANENDGVSTRWTLQGAGGAGFFILASGSVATANAFAGVNVLCGGYDETGTVYVKLNLGAIVPGVASAFLAPKTTTLLGRFYAVGHPWTAPVYEVRIAVETPSDALFTSLVNEVHGRLGVTAW